MPASVVRNSVKKGKGKNGSDVLPRGPKKIWISKGHKNYMNESIFHSVSPDWRFDQEEGPLGHE